jgi:hypothetical protein
MATRSSPAPHATERSIRRAAPRATPAHTAAPRRAKGASPPRRGALAPTSVLDEESDRHSSGRPIHSPDARPRHSQAGGSSRQAVRGPHDPRPPSGPASGVLDADCFVRTPGAEARPGTMYVGVTGPRPLRGRRGYDSMESGSRSPDHVRSWQSVPTWTRAQPTVPGRS